MRHPRKPGKVAELPGSAPTQISGPCWERQVFEKSPKCPREVLGTFSGSEMSARKFSRCPRSADRTFSGRLKTPKKAGKSETVKMPIPYQRLIKTTPPPPHRALVGHATAKNALFALPCTFWAPPENAKNGLFFLTFFCFFSARKTFFGHLGRSANFFGIFRKVQRTSQKFLAADSGRMRTGSGFRGVPSKVRLANIRTAHFFRM